MKIVYHSEPNADRPCTATVVGNDGRFFALGIGRTWDEARQRALNNARALNSNPPPPAEEGIEL